MAAAAGRLTEGKGGWDPQGHAAGLQRAPPMIRLRMAFPAFASFLAALALIAPQFSERTAKQFQSEYPTWALRSDLSAAVLHTMFVDPEGRVIRCEVVSVMGSERLAKDVCYRLKRTRLQPALDSSGTPVHGKIFSMTRMALPDTEMGRKVMYAQRAADLQLTVEQLPPEEGESKEIKIVIQVGEGGQVTACEGQNAEDVAYWSAACSSLEEEMMVVERSKDGLPVPYVQEMTVSFLEDGAS